MPAWAARDWGRGPSAHHGGNSSAAIPAQAHHADVCCVALPSAKDWNTGTLSGMREFGCNYAMRSSRNLAITTWGSPTSMQEQALNCTTTDTCAMPAKPMPRSPMPDTCLALNFDTDYATKVNVANILHVTCTASPRPTLHYRSEAVARHLGCRSDNYHEDNNNKTRADQQGNQLQSRPLYTSKPVACHLSAKATLEKWTCCIPPGYTLPQNHPTTHARTP